LELFHAFIDHLPGTIRPKPASWLELFAFDRIVRDEKVLDLAHQMIVDLLEGLYVAMIARGCCNGNQAIVTSCLLVLGLVSLDHTGQTRRNQTAHEGWLIHEYQHVQWIAITTFGGRHVAKIEGKHGPGWQNATKPEQTLLGIIFEFVSTSLGCVNDDV
jgi:hypothetical protein